MRKTTEDFIGTCQCCFGEFKVNETSKLIVLHGYQRPGYGYVIGNCEGHNHAPFEYDCTLTRMIIRRRRDHVAKLLQTINAAKAGEINEVHYTTEEYSKETRRYVTVNKVAVRGDDNFDRRLTIMIANLENEAIYVSRIADHLQAAVDAWKPGQVVGIDVPATGKAYQPRKAYDPDEADAAEKRAAEKAARDAKPGKLKVVVWRHRPDYGPRPEGTMAFHDWYANMERQKKEWVDGTRAKAKGMFEGKLLVREGSDWDLPNALRRSVKDVEVVIVHVPWEYRDQIEQFYPGAERFEDEKKKISFTSKEGD